MKCRYCVFTWWGRIVNQQPEFDTIDESVFQIDSNIMLHVNWHNIKSYTVISNPQTISLSALTIFSVKFEIVYFMFPKTSKECQWRQGFAGNYHKYTAASIEITCVSLVSLALVVILSFLEKKSKELKRCYWKLSQK